MEGLYKSMGCWENLKKLTSGGRQLGLRVHMHAHGRVMFIYTHWISMNNDATSPCRPLTQVFKGWEGSSNIFSKRLQSNGSV